jgi:hypothetical protein
MNFRNGEAEFRSQEKVSWRSVSNPPVISNPETRCDQGLLKPNATKYFLVLARMLCGPRETLCKQSAYEGPCALHAAHEKNHACQDKYVCGDGARKTKCSKYLPAQMCVGTDVCITAPNTSHNMFLFADRRPHTRSCKVTKATSWLAYITALTLHPSSSQLPGTPS